MEVKKMHLAEAMAGNGVKQRGPPKADSMKIMEGRQTGCCPHKKKLTKLASPTSTPRVPMSAPTFQRAPKAVAKGKTPQAQTAIPPKNGNKRHTNNKPNQKIFRQC
jgi:hypothetical protein